MLDEKILKIFICFVPGMKESASEDASTRPEEKQERGPLSSQLATIAGHCQLKQKIQEAISGGFSSIASNEYKFLNESHAQFQRVYAHWRFIQPRVDTVVKNLTVELIRKEPHWIDQFSSSVNWKVLDHLVNESLSANLTPIVEIGEGTIQALPSFQSTSFDPNVVGKPLYLAYMYLYSRAVVRRYKDHVRLWQCENELNVAYFASLGNAQRRWKLLDSAWADFEFLTTLLTTLIEAVKDEQPSGQVLQNLHTDIPQWVYELVDIKGYFLDAAKAWEPLIDIHALDSYPNMLVAWPCLGNLTAQRAMQIKATNPAKKLFIMETSYPVGSSSSSATLSNFTETNEALCASSAFLEAKSAEVDVFLYFKLQAQSGITAPPGGYSPMDLEALKFLSSLYEANGSPELILKFLTSPSHLEYLASGRFAKVVGGISEGFGLIDSSTGQPRKAFYSLSKLYKEM